MIQNNIPIKRVAYNKKRIVNITQQGIRYLDETGAEYLIDFDTCRRNWVAYVSQGTDFTPKEMTDAETVCIGWRNSIAQPPYIEFFTEPRTRFEFLETLFDRIFDRDKCRRNFQTLQQKILDAGWKTLDLS